jgi:D-alanine-D-alanine ligase
VSRSSGRCVEEALRVSYRNVIVLDLERTIGQRLHEARVDVVFPVLHGPPGEDGTFQGFLETIGLPYVGSGVRASAVAMDKILAKHLFRQSGLRVPKDVVVHRDEGMSVAIRRVLEGLGESVVVKPSSQGSAVGVVLCSSRGDLEQALQAAFVYDDRALVEEKIEGGEVTAGVLERDGLEVLPVIEVRTPRGSWYDYEHRYTKGLSEHIIPAPLEAAQYNRVEDMASSAHRVLECRDLSRADFVVPESGEPVLLEVNTLPGLTPTSLYPDAARAAGLSFEALVTHLVERARSRAARRN